MYCTCIYMYPFRFDSDLTSANTDIKQEQIEKERIEREKKMIETEKANLEEKYQVNTNTHTMYIHVFTCALIRN